MHQNTSGEVCAASRSAPDDKLGFYPAFSKKAGGLQGSTHLIFDAFALAKQSTAGPQAIA